MINKPQQMVLPLDYLVFDIGFKKNVYGIVIKPFDSGRIIYFDGKRVNMVRFKDVHVKKIYRNWIYSATRSSFEIQSKVFALYNSGINKKFLKTINNKAKLDRVLVYLIASFSLEFPEAYNGSKLEETALFAPSKRFSEVS